VIEGDRRLPGMGRKESYEPIVPEKVGNAGEDPEDPLEGRGEQTDVSGTRNMAIHRGRPTCQQTLLE
jgi:hypothetical protein